MEKNLVGVISKNKTKKHSFITFEKANKYL